MKRLHCLSLLLVLLAGLLNGCKKEDYDEFDPNMDEFDPNMGEMVSCSQITNQNGYTIMEAIYENGSHLYFKVLSDGTLQVVNYCYYYGGHYENESEYLFKGNLVIPESIVTNGKTFPVTSIAGNAFKNCKEMLSAVLPDNITEITEQAFIGCGNLKEIHLPDSLKSIGNEAFAGCGMSEIKFPPATRVIGYRAFTNCPNLSKIEFNDGLLNIGIESFTGCIAENITIPTSVKKINSKAFYSYGNTKYLTFLSQVPPEIGTDNWGGTIVNEDYLVAIRVPMSAIEAYRQAPVWKTNYAYYLVGY